MKLHLAVKAEYFAEIKAGTKTDEYRLVTPYWRQRLIERFGDNVPCEFDSIVLTWGYPKSGDPDRTLEFPWRGFTQKTITHPHFGPDPVEVFAIEVRK